MTEQFRKNACCSFCDEIRSLLMPVVIRCAYDQDGSTAWLCLVCRLSLADDGYRWVMPAYAWDNLPSSRARKAS